MSKCFYVHTVCNGAKKALASPRHCADSTEPSLLDNEIRSKLFNYVSLFKDDSTFSEKRLVT